MDFAGFPNFSFEFGSRQNLLNQNYSKNIEPVQNTCPLNPKDPDSSYVPSGGTNEYNWNNKCSWAESERKYFN